MICMVGLALPLEVLTFTKREYDLATDQRKMTWRRPVPKPQPGAKTSKPSLEKPKPS